MSRKALAQVALFGALVAGAFGYTGVASAHTPAAARAGMAQRALKTFSDAKLGYTFQYPSTWKLQKGVSTADNYGKIEASLAPTAVQMISPDQLVLAAVIAHKGITGTATIKKTEKALLYEDNTPLSKLSYSVKTINGASWPFSEMLAKSGKLQADEFVAATAHGAYTYYFLGAVVINKSSSSVVNARTQQIADVVSSFTFL